MSHVARALVIAGLLIAALPRGAWPAEGDKAAEAAAAFEFLYGADFKRVRATPDSRDDIALAKALLAAAREAAGAPEFLAVLCEKACELASVHPAGCATAVAAMDIEASGVPARAAACAEKIADIRQRQYEGAPREDRAKTADTLIDALLAAADAKAAAAAGAEATAFCRRAVAVAIAAKSPRKTAVEARLAAAVQDEKALQESDNLKRQLAADPKNVAVREKLVRLCLVDLDRPEEASKYVDGVQDTQLRKYVPAAARPVETAPELACLELGEWYRALGEASSKAAMFARARAYYRRFIEIHAAEDLDRTKASLALKKVEEEYARLGGPPSALREKWIDLFALVDTAQDVMRATWQRTSDGITTVAPAAMARLGLPIVVQGDYEWETRFVGSGGAHHVAFIFTVGKHRAIAQLNLGGKTSGLTLVNGKEAVANETSVPATTFNKGQEYTVLVKVQTVGGSTRFSLAVDGNPYFSWTGDPSALTLAPVSSAWAECPGSVGLGVNGFAVTFRGSRLRMLSGEARPLRPRPAAAAGRALPIGQWVDLLPVTDPTRDVYSGTWQRQPDGGLFLADSGTIAVPVLLEGDYEWELKFIAQSSTQILGFHVSVGKNHVKGYLNAGKKSGMELINGKSFDANGTAGPATPFIKGQEHTLLVKVQAAALPAKVAVTLDGKPCTSWTGDPSALSLSPNYRGTQWLSKPGSLGVGTLEPMTLRSSRLRMLAGEARMLR